MTARLKDQLSGVWVNELGSLVKLDACEGRLSGRYTSLVGGSHEEEELSGFYVPDPGNGGAVVGFVVAWPSSCSITTWSGRYRADHDLMTAFWLMREDTPAPNAWRSTTVGCDVFVRSRPD